jgi:hypothetical protein
MFVLATDDEVNGFTLDMTIGEFILTHSRMTIPQRGKMYSINEGNCEIWEDATTKYVSYCKSSSDDRKPYTLRYIGISCFIAYSRKTGNESDGMQGQWLVTCTAHCATVGFLCIQRTVDLHQANCGCYMNVGLFRLFAELREEERPLAPWKSETFNQ